MLLFSPEQGWWFIAGLKQQLAEADKQAEKLEALLDAHVSWGGQAPQGCIEGLKALGYRILSPGELDAETVERCIKELNKLPWFADVVSLADVEAVLRALASGKSTPPA